MAVWAEWRKVQLRGNEEVLRARRGRMNLFGEKYHEYGVSRMVKKERKRWRRNG